MSNPSNQIYQIKVTLDRSQPPIWRRIQVPGNTTLLKLHDILQIVMGWEDYHLHMFTIKGSKFGDPANDEYDELGIKDETSYKLYQVISKEGQKISYEYDFGDSWDHTLLVEKILPPQEDTRYPICLTGKRACPPEDVGGVRGYENFLEVIHNPDHIEHEDYLTWIGGEFDPEAFDLKEINAQLHHMGHGISTETLKSWHKINGDLAAKNFALLSSWSQTLPNEQQLIAEELPLRRDIIVLLAYLRDHKVNGTPSTGNFPLKVVREICAQFVNPPKLGEVIGEYSYPIRSETDVWSLYFRHVLVSIAGLAAGGMGLRWKLTVLGERFLAASAPEQVGLLLVTWWVETNWAIASPFYFGDGFMPPLFTELALKYLLELPLGKMISVAEFSNRMNADSRFVWTIGNHDNTQQILRYVIERTVIHPLVDFGVLQTEYKPYTIPGAKFREPPAFQITPFGKGLLEAIHSTVKWDWL